MAFCAACGRSIEKGAFCLDCEPMPEIKVKELKFTVCQKCNAFFYKNKWKSSSSIQEAAKYIVKDAVSKQFPDAQIRCLPRGKKPEYANKHVLEVEVSKKNQGFIIPVEVLQGNCHPCSLHEDYLEGELQLRNLTPEIISFVDNYLKSEERRAGVSKRVEFKNGFNLNFNSKKILHDLGNRLYSQFGGVLKESPRLFSRNNQTSKDIFRLNVYYEGPGFSTGDVIKFDNKILKIVKLGKHVTGTDMNGKNITFDTKYKEYSLMQKYNTTVSRQFPHIEILHPETYQSIPVENKAEVKIDEKVKVVIDGETAYLV
ncbi:MAG: NMD3-related protein [archaeon]